MRAAPPVLALLLLAGCVEFVDPVGLGLARHTRIDLTLEVVDQPVRSACPGPAALAPDSVVLCVQGTVAPGVSRLGERLRVLDDTLRAMGVPLTPIQSSDSLLRYRGRFVLPLASLEGIPLTATLPLVEGVQLPARSFRWYAAGRADPDTLLRTAQEGVRFRLDPPAAASTPRPDFEYWSVDVAGDTAVVGYDAFGVPHARYDFPAEVLAALGGARLVGELRWQRSYTPRVEGLQLTVRLSERLGWTVLTR